MPTDNAKWIQTSIFVGISVLRRVRKSDNNRIARACGATVVNRTDELKEEDVGTECGLFEVRKIGDEWVVIYEWTNKLVSAKWTFNCGVVISLLLRLLCASTECLCGLIRGCWSVKAEFMIFGHGVQVKFHLSFIYLFQDWQQLTVISLYKCSLSVHWSSALIHHLESLSVWVYSRTF